MVMLWKISSQLTQSSKYTKKQIFFLIYQHSTIKNKVLTFKFSRYVVKYKNMQQNILQKNIEKYAEKYIVFEDFTSPE